MLPLLLADFANYLDVKDRSEIQLNVTQTNAVAQPLIEPDGTIVVGPPTGGGVTTSINFFTQPQVRYRATNRRWEFTLGYLPSLVVTDLERWGGAGEVLLHAGQAGVAWIPARHLTLAINEDVSYGRYNAAILLPAVAPVAAGATAPPAGTGPQANAGAEPPPPPPGNVATNPTPMMPGTPVQAQPKPHVITIITSHTVGNVGIQVDRRTHIGFGVGYLTTGGSGATSQDVLPLQYGPSANANFSYALSRRDFVITNVTANQTQFTSVSCLNLRGYGDPTALCRPLDQFGAITQGYQHNFERNTALTAQAGVSLVRERITEAEAFRNVWFPTGLVSVAHHSGTKGLVATSATVLLAPAVNPLNGAVTNFIIGQATLAEPIAARVLLHATAGGGQGIPTTSPAATTIVQGDVGVAYVLNKQVTLEVGERAFWQRASVTPVVAPPPNPATTPPGTPPPPVQMTPPVALVEPVAFADFFATVTYFAVTVGAPELRF